MQTVRLPDGTALNFPDGTSQEEMRAAAARFSQHHNDFSDVSSGAASSATGLSSGLIRDALLGSPLDGIAEEQKRKREELATIRDHGDVNAPGTTSSPEPPGPLSRLVADGGFGPGGEHRFATPGTGAAYPLAEFADLAGASLGQAVIKPAVGLYGRAVGLLNPDPILAGDTVHAAQQIKQRLDEGFEGTRGRFLEAHPTGAGPAVALGTEFAAQSVPFLPGAAGLTARLGEGAAGLAGRVGPQAFEAGSIGFRLVQHAAGGGAFGGLLGLGNADPTAPIAEQAKEVGSSAVLGALMGGLGGLREVAQVGAQGAFLPSGRLDPAHPEARKFSIPPPPPEQSRMLAQAFEAEKAQARQPPPAEPGQPPQKFDPEAAVKEVEARWHEALKAGGMAGDEGLGAMADQTQASKAPEVKAPPLDEAAYLARREKAMRSMPGGQESFVGPGAVADAFRPEGSILRIGENADRVSQDVALGLRASPAEAAELARLSLPLAESPAEAARLTPSTPSWATTHEDGLAGWPDFARSRAGQQISPADLPFALENLPLTRWESTPGAVNPKRGAVNWSLGDTSQYRWDEAARTDAVSLFRKDIEGGHHPQTVSISPMNPLVIVRKAGLDVSNDMAEAALRRGHDAVVIMNPNNPFHAEVVTHPAASLAQRRSAYVEDLANGGKWDFERDHAGRFDQMLRKPPIDPEAGFLRLGRRPKPPPPPADQFDAVMPAEAPTPPGGGPLSRLQAIADSITDQWFNREDAPLRRMRRAGMGKEADYLEQLQGRGRGAGGMIDPRKRVGPVHEGTYVFDADLHGPGHGGSRRTGDGLSAILGGTDEQALNDLDALLAAQHHMELVGRKEGAQLQYEWGRAQRLNEMRQARLADKESLRSMFTDIRSSRAEELRATSRLSSVEMAAKLREAVVRQEQRHADDIRTRRDAAQEGALDAAQQSAEHGAELEAASQETQAAAIYARQLLRQELAAAVRPAQPGEVGPIDRIGPRSPGVVLEADQMAMALRGLAEKVGVSEGALHELLLRGREMDSLLREANASVSAAENRAGRAWSLLGLAQPEQQAARGAATSSIASAQRVAMGIRDQAAKYRAPEVERPPDLDLNIDPNGTQLAQSKLAELEQRYGIEQTPGPNGAPRRRVARLGGLADQIREWSIRSFLIPLKEAGRLSDQEFNFTQRPDGTFDYGGDIVGKNEQYAPFFRLVDRLGEDPEILAGTTKVNPIQSISGGLSPERPIARPLTSFVQQAQRVTLWAERQRVRNVFADAVDASPDLQAEIVKLAPASPGSAPRPRGGTFVAWKDGKRYEYAAPADVNLAFERLSPAQAHHVAYVAKVAARALRAGATITLEFPFRNLARDVTDSGVYGPGKVPNFHVLTDPFAGLLESVRGGKWAKEWRANGGALSGATSVARPALEATVRDAASGRRPGIARNFAAENEGMGFREGLSKKPLQTVARSVTFLALHPMEALADNLESATKIGVYRRARLQGQSPIAAAVLSRDASSPDFGRAGTFGGAWNQYEAFANAELQDLFRMGKAFRKRPAATTIKALSFLTLPAIANWAKNKDDPDYQNLPDWEKVAFYHPFKLDNGRWVRVPRPLGMLNIAFSYGPQKLLEHINGEDPEAAESFLAGLVQQSPAHYATSLDFLPTAAQPAVEAMAGPGGWSTFKQGPIVPQGLQGVLPEDQANDYTSGPALAIGASLGVSPLKVDSLIQGYGAFWGRTAAQAAGAGARAAGVEPGNDSFTGRLASGGQPELPIGPQDIPGVRGFVSTPAIGFASDPVTKLYKLSTEASKASRSLDEALKAGDGGRYQAIVRDHPEVMLEDLLMDTRKQLTALRDMKETILKAEGMSREQKQERILQIDQAVTQLAGAMMHASADYLRGQRSGRN